MSSVSVVGHEGRAAMSWQESSWNSELRASVKRLVALRREHAALRRGRFVPLHADDEANVYAFARRLGQETLVVVLNAGVDSYKIAVPVGDELSEGTRLVDLLGEGECAVRQGELQGAALAGLSGVALRAVG
jgi:hypothetical protein